MRRIKTEILPRYPNVDDVVAITHTYGCGVAIDAPARDLDPHNSKPHLSSEYRKRADDRKSGCGNFSRRSYFRRSSRCWSQMALSRVQDHHGFAEIVAAIMNAAEKRLAILDRLRVNVQRIGLSVGLQCGVVTRSRASPAIPPSVMPQPAGTRGHGVVLGSNRGPRRDSSTHTASD